MATQDVGPSDPVILRLMESQNSALVQPAGLTQPPAVNGGQPASSSTGTVRSLAPVVSGSEVLYPQATSSTAGNAITITSSVNNQSGDVTTVYTSSGRITATTINQTIYNYTAGGGSTFNSLTGGQGINVTGTTDIVVSTIGNISVVNLDGNPTNVLHGDGTWSADQTNYGNSNVASYLPTFTGTIGANTLASTGASGSNVQINANGATFTFGQGGALYWPAPLGNIWVIEPNIDNEFEIKSTSNVIISTDTSNSNAHFTFDSDGIFTAPSNVNLLGTRLNVGPQAANTANLLNPTLVIADSGAGFIQAVIINNDGAGSADLISYGAGGSDLEAWADLGYAGFSFNDPNYTITAPGDGYVFVQGYANGTGGNMVLATGENGNSADIVFATGGFLTSNEFGRIDHANSLLHLSRAGSGIKFNDGTIQNSAAIVWTTAPLSNTSPGTSGEAAYDAGGNLFICVAANTWAKFSGTTSW